MDWMQGQFRNNSARNNTMNWIVEKKKPEGSSLRDNGNRVRHRGKRKEEDCILAATSTELDASRKKYEDEPNYNCVFMSKLQLGQWCGDMSKFSG